jgi:ubiquinone/menaquinone biosynthesis C-methylase UbiE
MGRVIAPVMSFQGAEWLVRPEREQEEQPEKMLDALKLRPGDVVADVGAGVGYTSLRIARRVGPKGLVLATDIQPEMIQMLRANAAEFGSIPACPNAI